MTRSPYDAAVDAELARWAGVTIERRYRAKHRELVLRFAGQHRFVVYPTSPSNPVSGALNHVSDVRHALLSMGAIRETVAKARSRTRRCAPPSVPPLHLIRTEPLRKDPSRDPWAPLLAFLAP